LHRLSRGYRHRLQILMMALACRCPSITERLKRAAGGVDPVVTATMRGVEASVVAFCTPLPKQMDQRMWLASLAFAGNEECS